MVYVRVLCGVMYVSMGLCQEEDLIQPWRMTSSGDRHQGCGVQVQVEHHEEIMLEACRPLWTMDL